MEYRTQALLKTRRQHGSAEMEGTLRRGTPASSLLLSLSFSSFFYSIVFTLKSLLLFSPNDLFLDRIYNMAPETSSLFGMESEGRQEMAGRKKRKLI